MLQGLLTAARLSLENNSIVTVDTNWFTPLSFGIGYFSMKGNPSQCIINATSSSLISCDCAPGYYGTGRSCTQATCEVMQLPTVDFGQWGGPCNAPPQMTVDTGTTCPLTCSSNLMAQGNPEQPTSCLGGVWGYASPVGNGLVEPVQMSCVCVEPFINAGVACLAPCLLSGLPTVARGNFPCADKADSFFVSSQTQCTLSCEAPWTVGPSVGAGMSCENGSWVVATSSGDSAVGPLTCRCPEPYVLEQSQCVAASTSSFWSTHRGLLIGVGVAFVLVLVAAGFGMRRALALMRGTRHELALREHLLSEARAEAMQLRHVFEIREEEVELQARIDADAPGTFGEVRLGLLPRHAGRPDRRPVACSVLGWGLVTRNETPRGQPRLHAHSYPQMLTRMHARLRCGVDAGMVRMWPSKS